MHCSGLWLLATLFVLELLAIGSGRLKKGSEYTVGVEQQSFRPRDLADNDFIRLSSLTDSAHLREAVRHILVPRVVGTAGHKQVREYIVNSLQSLKWSVELNTFHEQVPILGKLHFHNIIARLNPNAERYLVLSCHYDSKYFANEEFLGATDSAVPCAMLLNLAHVLQDELKAFQSSKLSLMLLFFDGEEAFKEWGPKDSIYGARHLAHKWQHEDYLKRLDMLMLLDLIGAPDPKFYSFFENTESWYSRFLDHEDRLASAGLMERYVSSGISRVDPSRFFQPQSLASRNNGNPLVEDDHIPFLRRNVPVLHLIPLPFPDVWHKMEDNESIIDYVTTENVAKIVRLFTMEYLLSGLDTQK